jgi:hypothetical protein
VDLEKGILEVVLISLDNWQHVQQLDYEKLPFKCKIFHEYGHFEELQEGGQSQFFRIE